jgi:ATP-dependent DNA helicase RecG
VAVIIESWGKSIMKIVDSCKAAGLPSPIMEEDGGGFIVRLFIDRFSEEELKQFGLNDRQIRAVQYVNEKGKITNGEYQTLNSVSKRTATNDLSELVEKYKLVNNIGFGAGSFYELIIGQ